MIIRKIIETRSFSKEVESLVKKRLLSLEDFAEFKKELSDNPEKGSLIVGTGGVRKTRLKSPSKGKSGGFRVCYYYLNKHEELFLLDIYAKSEQENLTSEQKKVLKEFVSFLKGAKHE